jgi:ParB-like chromosome segregation protein Spo0J
MTVPKVEAVPLAKLTPAPWNPRTIREERFQNLCRSIEADPEFLWRRPILAQLDGTIMAGNMRYRAAVQLKMSTIPAIIEDVPEGLAKERALRDNAQWGDWQEDQLAEMVYAMAASGSDVKLLGLDEQELAKLLGIVPDFAPVGEDEQGRLDQKAPVTCPECGHVFTI